MSTEIGSVSVRVRPDTDGFRKLAEAELKAAARGLEAQVRLSADASDLIGEVRRAANAAERAAGDVKLKIRYDSNSLASVQREITKLDDRLQAMQEIDLSVDLDQGDLARTRAALSSIADAHIEAQLNADNIEFADFRRAVESQVEDAFAGFQFSPELDPRARDRIRRDVESMFERIEALNMQVTPELSDREKFRIEREVSDLEGHIAIQLEDASLRTAQARLAVLSRARVAEIIPRVNKSAAARTGLALAALSGGRVIGDVASNFGEFIGGLDRSVGRISAVSNALANLSSLGLAATSNLFAISGSLAQIGGASLALPGIFGGVALGLGATVAVLKDFGNVLPDVGDRFSRLQDVMSTDFWSIARVPMQDFIDSIFPQFAAGMRDTSSALGQFFASFSESATGAFDGDLAGMFDGLSESILVAGQYTDSYTGIIAKLGAVGADNLPRLAGWVGDVAQQFDSWLAEKGPDGIQDFIDVGVDALADLGSIAADTGSTLASIFQAAEKAGGSTLDRFAKTMESVAEAAKSDGFQNGLVTAFRGAHEALDAISRGAGPEFQSFMARLADTLGTVLPSAGRAAGEALGSIFDALDQPVVSDALISFFANVEEAVSALAPAMPGVADGFAGIAEAAGVLVREIAQALGPALEDIGPAVGDLARDLVPLIEGLGSVTGALAGLASGVLGSIPSELLLLGGAFGAAALAAGRLRTAWANTGNPLGNLNFAMMQARDTLATTTANMTTATTAVGRFRSAAGLVAPTLRRMGGGLAIAGAAALTMSQGTGATNTAMGAMIGLVGGPWGAAVGAVVGAAIDMQAAQADAAEATTALNDAMGNVDADFSTYQQELLSTADAHRELASSMNELSLRNLWDSVTSRVAETLGGANGYDEKVDDITAALREADQASLDLNGAMDALGRSLGILDTIPGAATFGELQEVATQLEPALDGLDLNMRDLYSTFAEGGSAWSQMSSEIRRYMEQSDSVSSRTSAVSDAFTALGTNALGASVNADALKASLDNLLNPALDAEAATDQWLQSLQGISELDLSAGFRGVSEGAMANREASRSYVADVTEMLAARARDGASMGELIGLLGRSREGFIGELRAANLSEEAIRQRVNAMGLTPKLIRTVFKNNGLDVSQRDIRQYQRTMAELPKQLRTIVNAEGIPGSKRDVQRLKREYDLTPKQVRTLMSVITAQATKNTDTARKKVEEFGGLSERAELEAHREEAMRSTDTASKAVRSFGNMNESANVGVNDNATGPINAIRSNLNALNGDTAVVTVIHRTVYQSSGRPGGNAANAAPRAGTNAGAYLPQAADVAASARVLAKGAGKAFNKNFINEVESLNRSIDQVFSRLWSKFDSKKQRDKLRRMFKSDMANFDKARREVIKLQNEYQRAADRLADLQRRQADYTSQVRNTIINSGDITQVDAVSYDGIVRGMEDARDRAQRFAAVIKQLMKDGLNKTSLQQILAAGPAALETAEQVLAGGVDQINDIQKELEDAAKEAGLKAGDFFFGDKVVDAEKVVRDLEKALIPIQRAFKKFASDLQRALQAQLKKKFISISIGRINLPKEIRRLLNDEGKKNKPKPKPKSGASPMSAGLDLANVGSATQGVTVYQRNLNYYAAPNKSLPEEDLFAAINRTDTWAAA